MNVFDIALLLIIALALVLAVRRVISDRKNGGCCGNCSGCSCNKQCSKK